MVNFPLLTLLTFLFLVLVKSGDFLFAFHKRGAASVPQHRHRFTYLRFKKSHFTAADTWNNHAHRHSNNCHDEEYF
ncbi:hypothetical protein THIOM_000715 [Candidatus Thiomargarita nelsonii]|uniref:Uncharacterized protein n=1 Tax=Candidatus Thiomargarita nelsonii TaxID=1003181 RepID=A0A176S5S0_9GAMM|nr:hypothetical protein THIOM_000715 [Candidatus Thiomargarita nelsonii]